ncbi:3-phosphoshikimate 1-carboxyvinyltransferase [Iodidimonas muriae]|uniref:3-phosphoshikimate 1-carboxyvinyltransferase n=1 Tax=Iodidimonas muriae TaxID=261467 RepID=A0ABQ2LAJ8_9PROT|nr:3-phosphoshikimate 1-carboxyvinyltransferase [Iodidimonas muriae]GGO08614.1 3-phosphoshikimate 1-carboxyvinyltransferase [Iodidimonas muriae]
MSAHETSIGPISGQKSSKAGGAQSKCVAHLKGQCSLPGDKSISHRALMLGALAVGRTHITGLLEGEDVHATAAALSAMGVGIRRESPGQWVVDGVGVGALQTPDNILDMGNSGTSTRLLMGLVASQPIRCFFTGDGSLRKRPMNRVIAPLSQMGAVIESRGDGRLPLLITGSDSPMPIDYTLPVASAQVKSAILLAALNTPGTSVVREPKATRDHSERMLKAMGAQITVEESGTGETGRIIRITGEAELSPVDISVPGDISSAAFPLVAAAIRPGSQIRLKGVGINPLRAGILTALEQMGAPVTIENRREEGGEPVADLVMTGPERLKAVTLDPAIAPLMIDEFPVLFVAAACAQGSSRFTGLEELRVKESDRIAAMAAALSACGVAVEEVPDGLIVHGTGSPPLGGATITTHLDHRIAMSALVLGCASDRPVSIDDAAPITTSFPDFMPLMNALGTEITLL